MQPENESYVMVRELHHLNKEYQLAPAPIKSMILTDIQLIQEALTLLKSDSPPVI